MEFKARLSQISLLLALTGAVTANLGLGLPSQAANQSVWRSFAPDGGGFSILMPDRPTPAVTTEPVLCLKTGKMVDRTTYTYHSQWMDQDGSIYAVVYHDFPTACLVSKSAGEELEMVLKLVSALYESGKPGVLQHKQLLKLNGNPGFEVKLRSAEKGRAGLIWTRVFVTLRPNDQVRTYEITVISSKEQALQQTIANFFKSFKLTN
jgi:hypothetical protein